MDEQQQIQDEIDKLQETLSHALEAGDEDWVFAIEWELCYLDQALKETEEDNLKRDHPPVT